MRLASFVVEGRPGYGIVEGDHVVDLATREVPTLRAFLERGEPDRERLMGVRALPLAEVQWLPPIPDPDKTVCVGLNFRAHAEEAKLSMPSRPSLFLRVPGAQVGHRRAIVRPSVSTQFDYEAELAVVIGRRARHVAAADAMHCVAGFSCFGDHSIRDWQRHAPQITPGKNFDRSGAFGPWLTTPDEVADLDALEIIGRLNGREMQRDRVAGMIFPISEIIAYISAFTTLLPGDVIATGTPAGVGMARQPPAYMQPGDTFAVEIPGVGTLENTVIAEEHA